MRVHGHFSGAALLILTALASGCGERRSVLAPALPSGPPAVTLKASRELTSSAASPRYAISWQLNSGSADHFVYTINPRSADRTDASWQSTTATTFSLQVPAKRTEIERLKRRAAVATTFVVRAVDARGRMSQPAQISIIDDNIAPTVQITRPAPSDLTRQYVPSSVEIDWRGMDPDGVPTTEPAYYKWTLLTPSSYPVSFSVALADPDSVRRYYEPLGYAGWTTMGGIGAESPATKFLNLVPLLDYMFVVVAQDRQGAYTQVFSLNTNLLDMRVVAPGTGGPRLTLFNSFFNYTYPMGSFPPAPVFQVPLEVPAGQPIPIQWSAVTPPGASTNGYRWALDIANIDDETPRLDEATDLSHWSQWSLSATNATVGPFAAGGTHRLYVEARDSNGLISLGIVAMTAIAATQSRDLLVVDDTRFLPDRILSGSSCVAAPIGRWPTAAELDTFLFARGGTPWRCYPVGTLSSPGLFAGYTFDTLGTRSLPGGTVPLSTLLNYAHVIWLTDAGGALNTNPPGSGASPITSLRYMSQPGSQNPLGAYVVQGGNLWAAGGGIDYASLIAYNRTANDINGTVFSSMPPYSELIPGLLPYDIGGWQSEIKVVSTAADFNRNLGRLEGTGSAYDQLPVSLDPKTSATDPLPPLRPNPGDFYQTQFAVEYLSQPNVVEANLESTLDSLYSASGAIFPPGHPNPTMTIYHPGSGPPVVWSGFSLWNFQRAECQGLVDFVLGRYWGLPKFATVSSGKSVPRGAAPPPGAVAP